MTETVYIATGAGVDRSVYHTDPDCRALEKANGSRGVPYDAVYYDLSDRRVCKICSGEADTAPTDKRRSITCRSCGAKKDASGTCPFCAACDDIGVTNGRHKWHRAARRGAGGD